MVSNTSGFKSKYNRVPPKANTIIVPNINTNVNINRKMIGPAGLSGYSWTKNQIPIPNIENNDSTDGIIINNIGLSRRKYWIGKVTVILKRSVAA